MRFLPVFFLILSVFVAQSAPAALTEAQASVVIQQFLGDPNAPAAKDAARQILQYTDDTPDHEVVVDAKYMPWMKVSQPPEESGILLAAFMAGNLQEQIKKHTSKPEPYAGLLAVIDVYNKLSAHRLGFHIPSVDHLIELEKQGKLKAYAES